MLETVHPEDRTAGRERFVRETKSGRGLQRRRLQPSISTTLSGAPRMSVRSRLSAVLTALAPAFVRQRCAPVT